MPRYARQNSASDRWWDQYNLGLRGVCTGSIANQLGTQHRRPQAWEKPARAIIVPKKPSAAATVHRAPAATEKGDGKFLRHVGNGLLYFFGLITVAKAVVSDPFCLISFAAIGGAIALYCRYRG